MPEVGGVEVRFADGTFVVDDVYVPAIMEGTKRHPERFSFKDAMALMNTVFNKDVVSQHISKIRSDHLKVFGL